jgi:hypothetical protein
MTWNYRIVRHRGGENYVLHEVYYEDDRPVSMTADGCRFGCDGSDDPKSEICGALEMALNGARNRPILDENDFLNEGNK